MSRNPIMRMLEDAAARGVKVTIITNDRPVPTLTLKWIFKETNCDATARFRGAGYDLYVEDRDGDSSWWLLRRGREIIARGEVDACEPFYHFDACLLAAEAALRDEVERRFISGGRKTKTPPSPHEGSPAA